ncbi:MAG: hypothetical protein KJO44_04290, partial [Gemmatimonadetes bacterium]|nr:hypothetical protein [Gemmatimonadota bacterium]
MRGATRERSVRAVLGLLLCLPLGASQGMDEVSLRRGGPVVRVGIALERESITLSSKGGLKLEDGLTAQPAGLVPPGASLLASVDGSALRLEGDLPTVPARVPSVRVYAAVEGAAITVAGRPYRGSVELRVAGEDRVSAINILPLEDYLLGVVPLEIGPRGPDELAAVEAQAVAARTYAVRNLDEFAEEGYDICSTPRCQVYGG